MVKPYVLFAVLTAIFWGLYAPTLALSRAGYGASNPFKPYLTIGVAYLVWGILGGLIGMKFNNENFEFFGGGNTRGTLYGFLGGSLGAWGALTLTIAIFSGGKPFQVMPIVFGGAVTVSALASLYKEAGHAKVHPMLYVGILGIVVCAAIVAHFTPHAPPPGSSKPAAVEESKPSH